MHILPAAKEKSFTKNIIALFWLSVIVWAVLASVYQGFSQYSASRAKFFRSDSEATEAIRFDSANPEAYKVRGTLALKKEDFQAALGDFKRAVELRPNDYLLWMRLGYTHYKLNDFALALEAYDRAIAMAPQYAQPQRYKGILYLKANDPEQAFNYLTSAANLDSTLLPEALHRARLAFPDNPVAIEQAIQPNSLEARKAMVLYFINHNMMSNKTKAFLTGEQLDDRSKEEFVSRFIAAGNFDLAFSIWSSKKSSAEMLSDGNVILNGNFETEIDPQTGSFGWRPIDDGNIALSVDQNNRYSGSIGIKIQFSGNSDPDTAVISQLTVAKPGQKYRLTFAARTQELTTGGLPVVSVIDTTSKSTLGRTSALPSNAKEWQKYTIDFVSATDTKALLISLHRLKCASNPCPIFGTLWIDDVVLKEI